ncbi:MAG: hypothetical protein ACI9MR_003833 [Myxococcota bacterium]|jgi:hypothetical protein
MDRAASSAAATDCFKGDSDDDNSTAGPATLARLEHTGAPVRRSLKMAKPTTGNNDLRTVGQAFGRSVKPFERCFLQRPLGHPMVRSTQSVTATAAGREVELHIGRGLDAGEASRDQRGVDQRRCPPL